ncbi:hypothetical protein G7Y89_g12487 [Cudoniella acicularis]|uniref:Kinesin-like protein n=1 Tax=Cudoniella acicularis TaxID=354080 RepID=A0A8H4VWX1_9HELO|nr:hypothetical protein G7Y89_g12487 [Cudoniella acicularis]
MDSFYYENKDYFDQRIQQVESSSRASQAIRNFETLAEAPDTAVYARIRPLTEREIEESHIRGVLPDSFNVASVHEPRRKVNGKPDLNSSSFTVDEVYGPDKSTRDIYDDRVQELTKWVWDGGMSLLLAYGRTGSGKTFTVTGLEKLVVEELMDGKLAGVREVHVCIFEVTGNNLYDLLNDRVQVSIMEDAFGSMQLVGILEKNPTTSDEFLNLIETAKAQRSVASTARNDESSRSHSVCRVRIVTKETTSSQEGSFLLVDLAGSEASADTQHHSRERMAETREINKSLTILKDCIRARALWSISQADAATQKHQKHVHIPFRSSKLTQVLKSAFDVKNTQTYKTLVIACIAPSILDVAHSKNTLRYAETLKVPVPKSKPRPFDKRIPTTWTNDHVKEWVKKNSGKPPINPLKLAPKESGIEMCRLNEDEFCRRALLTPGVELERAKLLYFKLWTLHIDSRALLSRPQAIIETGPTDTTLNRPQKAKTIKPGSFFQLDTEDIEDGIEIVMAMGPDIISQKSKKGEFGYICAVVGSSATAFESNMPI